MIMDRRIEFDIDLNTKLHIDTQIARYFLNYKSDFGCAEYYTKCENKVFKKNVRALYILNYLSS